jgi:hypothetical protein
MFIYKININMLNEIYFKSPLHRLANQEFDWLPMDTKELFQKNLKTKKDLLEKYNWINQTFTYKFNSKGFRCNELEENQDCVIFLGCSFTMGIGLPIETVWPTLVAKKLGLKCYNLGICGGSNDTAFRLGYHYIPKLKPKLVVFLSPVSDRFELFTQTQNVFQYGSWYKDSFYKTWTQDDFNGQINKEKNSLALHQICKENGIRFLKFDCEGFPNIDLARDLMHPGIESNRAFSKQVLKSLK